MRIVHFADLHLDAAFAWTGGDGAAARKRRGSQRIVLKRITDLVREVDADALFSGGDLYEHELVTPDTAAFLRDCFARLGDTPVFLAPGNHDWHGPGSLYERVVWSDNVHVFREPRLTAHRLAPGYTLWGGAHCAPAGTTNFLDGFQVQGGGVHLALFHASEMSWLAKQGKSKEPHAPFEAGDIAGAGLHHAFLGHYHRPREAERHTYPGNPDPLEFGEHGLRGAVVAEVSAAGKVDRRWHRVAETGAHDIELDLTGARTREEIRRRLLAEIKGLDGAARIMVRGEIAPELDLVPQDLRRTLLDEGFDAVLVRSRDLRAGYDVDALRDEPTVRGQFVADVMEAEELDAETRRRVLVTGLRAFDGRKDLEVF